MDVFDLAAKITLDSSEFNSGLDSASTKANSFGSKLGGGLATAAKFGAAGLMAAAGAGLTVAGAFVKGTAAVAEYGDSIDKMSQKMGMSATAYQEWSAVMQHSGTSMEALKAGMKTLATAAETGKDAFDRLGISQQQIAEMSQEELFSATITALQGVTDETERTYLAGQLLGRGATELGPLLNKTAEETQQMKDRVHELGGVMSDEAVAASARYADSLQDMRAAIDGAKRSLAEGFLPAISDVMDGIGNVVSGFDVEGGLQQIEQGVNAFISNLNNVIPRLADLAARIIPAFGRAIVANLPALAQTGLDVILSLANGIANHIPDLIARLPQIIVGIVNFITSNLPAIVQTGVQIIIGIIQGLAQALPQLIAAAPQILMAIGRGILQSLQILWDNGPQIVQAIGQGILNALSALGDLGVQIVTAIAEGILSALGWLGDAIISVFKGGLDAGDTATAGYRAMGEHAATETTDGYRSKSGEFGSTVAKSIHDGQSKADAGASGFSGSGGKAASSWMSGWDSGSSGFSGSVGGTMSGAVKTANGWAPQFSTPGQMAINNLSSPFMTGGGEVVAGVGNTMDNALSAGEAGALMFGQVGSNMVSNTTKSIAAAAPAVSSSARGVVVTAFTVANAATSMFVSVGSNMANGIARGVLAAAGRIASAAVSVVTQALAAAKAAAAIASPSKKFRDEVGLQMGLGVAEGLEDSEDKVIQAANRLAEKTYQTSAEWLRRETKFRKLTLEEQLEVWQEIQSQFITTSKQWIEAEEEIFDLREKIAENKADAERKAAEDAFADAKEQIRRRTKFEKLSVVEQIQMWDDLLRRYEANSEEYLEIDEKIFDLREDLAESYERSVSDIWKNITSAYDNYANTLQSRTDKIASAYGLFDDVQDRSRLNGDELVTNLTRQVNVMTSFYDQLEQLSQRGAGAEMVEEIRQMGPKAADQLDALVKLSDKQFKKYVELYGKKQQLANSTAVKELAKLKDQTGSEIKAQLRELDRLYDATAPTIGESFAQNLAQGIKDGLGSVVNAATRLAEEANNAFLRKLNLSTSVGSSLGGTKSTLMSQSALGAASTTVVNTLANGVSGVGGTFNINMQVDGQTIARTTFDPLKNYAASQGQPIVVAT